MNAIVDVTPPATLTRGVLWPNALFRRFLGEFPMFVSASTNWRSSTRRVKKYFVCALVVLCAFAVSGAAFSQPPRPGGDRSGWNNRGGRPGGDNRGGRTGDNRGGRPGGNAEGERGQNGPQEGDFQEQGIPGQGGDFQEEGQQQEGWVQEGPQQQEGWGQEGPQPPQQQEGWGRTRRRSARPEKKSGTESLFGRRA